MVAPQWAKQAAGAVAVLALTGIGTGCGGDDQPQARPSGPSMMAPATRQLGVPAPSASNRPPRILGVTLSPASPGAGEDVTARVDAEDPDGDRISYRFVWNVGERRFGAAGKTLARARARRGDTLAVTVTARDARANSAPFTATTVVRNSAPVITALGLEPSGEIHPGDEVRVAPQATDVDGDSISFRYRWTVNGSPVAEQGPALSTAGLARGGSIEVEVGATDGEDWSEPLRSPLLQLGNAPPRIVSEPTPPGDDGVFRYRVSAEDPDRDFPIVYSLETAPAGMTIDPRSGQIDWAPRMDQLGQHRVVVVAEDAQGGRATQGFHFVVADPAQPPASP